MVARFGGILAPYINILADIWKPFPLIIFGTLAFIGGLLSLYLPETLGKELPETIEEGENFGKRPRKGDVEDANTEELKKLNTQIANEHDSSAGVQNGDAKTKDI